MNTYLCCFSNFFHFSILFSSRQKNKGPPGEPALHVRVDNEPGRPEAESEVVRAGQTIQLRCMSRGGNPIPSLTFMRNGRSFGPGPRLFENWHSFRVTIDDNNAIYACTAQNQADRHASSRTVTLNVLCKYDFPS